MQKQLFETDRSMKMNNVKEWRSNSRLILQQDSMLEIENEANLQDINSPNPIFQPLSQTCEVTSKKNQLKISEKQSPMNINSKKVVPLGQMDSYAFGNLKSKLTSVSSERRSRLQSLKTKKTFDEQMLFQEKNIKKQKVMGSFQKLMVFFQTKKFVRSFRLLKHKSKSLQEYHYQLIGDKASEGPQQQTFIRQSLLTLYGITNSPKNQLKKMITSFKKKITKLEIFQKASLVLIKLFQNIPLNQPESTFKFIWDIIMTCIRVYYLFVIPVQLFFSQRILQNLNGFGASLLTFQAIDIMLNFNTSYYEVGQLVQTRKQIINNYFQNDFLLDLLFFLLLFAEYVIFSESPTEVRNIQNFIKRIEEIYGFQKNIISILALIKMTFIILFFEHIFCCIWYFVGDMEIFYGQYSWIIDRNLQDASLSSQYIQSLYFSAVTMVSVGYGDITPLSIIKIQYYKLADVERIFCIFFMLFASIQISYSVSAIGSIISELNQTNNEIKKKVRVINQYMQKKKIGAPLQYQIRDYLSYYYKEQTSSQSELEQQIIQELSEPLKEQLLLEANNLILECPMFSKHFSQNFKKHLIKYVKECSYFPENSINDNNEFNLYFIEQGVIEHYHHIDQNSNHQSLIRTLSKGQSFGLLSFITGQQHFDCFKSQGFSKLLFIQRSQFLQIIKDYPIDYEQFCMLKDKIIYQNDYSKIDQQCYSCFEKHVVQMCPLIHYIPDREKIIKTHQFSSQQLGQQQSPKKVRNNYHSFLDIKQIEENAQEFMQVNSALIGNLCFDQNEEEINDDDSDDNYNQNENQNDVHSEQQWKVLCRNNSNSNDLYQYYFNVLTSQIPLFQEQQEICSVDCLIDEEPKFQKKMSTLILLQQQYQISNNERVYLKI